MKDEIKEILNNPKILMLSYGNYISLDDYVKLKDCITNLQEENKRLSRTITDYDELLMQKNNVIDKAIEYCNLYTRLSAKDLLYIFEGDKDE